MTAPTATTFPKRLVGALTAWALCAHGEVTFDGTLGPADTLTGNMQIDETYGTVSGSGRNLFHSFSVFNVNAGESASFTHTTPSIVNIVGRVTGGSTSTIAGSLASDANLWLFNPGGIVITTGAALDVNGSLAISTADYAFDRDGDRLELSTDAAGVIAIDDLAGFGFSGNNGRIDVDAPVLSRQGGDTVFAGFGVTFSGTDMTTAGGDLTFASFNAPGEMSLNSDGSLASVTGVEGAISLDAGTSFSTNAMNAGRVLVRGGVFTLDNSSFTTRTGDVAPTASSGAVDVDVTELHLLNGGQLTQQIVGDAMSSGIRIRARDLVAIGGYGASAFPGESVIGPSGLFALVGTGATQQGGSIRIDTTRLQLTDGGLIATATFGSGSAGAIDIDASNLISIRNEGAFDAFQLTGISATALATGRPGTITLSAPEVEVRGGTVQASNRDNPVGGRITIEADRLVIAASDVNNKTGQIVAATFGAGPGGAIDINAAQGIEVRGTTFNSSGVQFPSGIFVSTRGAGTGGDLLLNTRELTIADGAQIVGATFTSGRGGNISIAALDTLSITGRRGADTGIFNNTFAGGPAGFISIDAGDVAVTSGAGIAGAVLGGAGRGGNIGIAAQSLLLRGSFISAFTGAFGDGGVIDIDVAGEARIEGDPATFFDGLFANTTFRGNAGGIQFSADNLTITEGALITTSTFGFGNAGFIELNIADTLNIVGNGNPSTGIANSTLFRGNAGSISVSAGTIDINTGLIQAATGPGSSGNAGAIDLSVDTLIARNGGVVEVATQGTGAAGTINVNARDVIVSGRADPNNADSNSQISAQSFGSSGQTGSVRLVTENLTLANAGTLLVQTQSSNVANTPGRADIIVTGDLTITEDQSLGTGIVASTSGAAPGGIANLQAARLTMDGGVIASESRGAGSGGSIDIAFGELDMRNGALVSSRADSTGDAGVLQLNGSGDASLESGSQISSDAALSLGGDIFVTTPGMLALRDSQIEASAGANGNGGNVNLDVGVLLMQNGKLLAQADAGNGGAINIASDGLLIDYASEVSADSGSGTAGSVVVSKPNDDVSGAVQSQEANTIVTPQPVVGCVERAAGTRSTLRVTTERSHLAPPRYLLADEGSAMSSGARPDSTEDLVAVDCGE